MSRLLLVSNRLPYSLQDEDGEPRLVRSSGGLVSGLGPVHEERDSLWIGTLGGNVDAPELLARERLVDVELPPEIARRHYEGYSNQVLWPLFHYLLAEVSFHGSDYDAYREVNRLFARTILEHAGPEDTIWIHDYLLMLVPAMVRAELPDATIGFFLHVPFPSSEVFRILPGKEEILRGLLGADLVGVHTYDYGRHLVSSFRRALGVDFDESWITIPDGTAQVGVFPIGIDAAALEARAAAPEVVARLAALRAEHSVRRVVLGVDRLDYTKGLPLRLQAFRRLLVTEPRWRNEAKLIQIAVPSRSGIDSYQELKEEVERSVGEINGAFSSSLGAPIHYIYRSVPEDELSALYRLADVGWVTPVRDGMNLVAKEYVAHRLDDTGTLVLSEFAGAAAEMGEAILHNPWDVDGTAKALHRALTLPETEARSRMRALRHRVRANDVHRWVERFLQRLEDRTRARRRRRSMAHQEGEGDWIARLIGAFADAPHVLLALDYDGTLVELRPTPEEAAPTDEVRALLRRLGELAGVSVVVISGRDRATLGRWLGDLPVDLVAEHGLHHRARGGEAWDLLLPDVDLDWKDEVREVLEEYAARCPGALIEEKFASLAWHYRQVEPAFGSWQARELGQHLREVFANTALEVLHGSKVIEVRPQGFDKGRAYRLLRSRLPAFDLVLAAGDDRTDEDLFEVMEDSDWRIKVGWAPSRAAHRIPSPVRLRELLTSLADARTR